MSTRATYCFAANPKQFTPKATFYIHHDGYPEGAADYFRAMLAKGNDCNAFMRANERAELTPSHEAHGDTEYRYDIDKKGNLLVREGYGEEWELLYVGSLTDFLAKY